jgi:type IV pilus assembly protein PilC
MPTSYAYKVRDKQGKMLSGVIEAETQTAVVTKLREMGLAPLQIAEQKSTLGGKEFSMPWKKRVKQKDLAVMSRQFSTMINSGLSLLRALNILAEQTENQKLASILGTVRQDVERGQSLSQALQRHEEQFGKLYISMIKAGETGGVLDQSLVRLAETLEKQVALRHKIKSAMTYPVVVGVLVVLILAGMLLFVVPTFEALYRDLGGTLPLPTRLLIGVSNIFRKFFFVVGLAGAGGVWGFRRWIKTPGGRAAWDAFKLKVPIFGGLVHKTALSRYARTLGALLRSGVPILQALEIVKDTVNNDVMSRAVDDVQLAVKEGSSMAKPLERHTIFPSMVTQMIAVGEETGAVDEMLAKIAEFYDQEIDATVSALTSLIEPLLIVVMGLTVGGMVVALYMPMFNLINLVK